MAIRIELMRSGYTYDGSGNTTADPSGKAFTYDAENKQTQVTNGGGTLGNYAYDGDGKRVKKYNTSTSDNAIFLYDAAGKLIEERDLSGNLLTSYIYAGGRLLSTETSGSVTNYLTTDHLGSPRINTNGSGNVTARHDYLPFGEEIFTALTAQRTSGVGYPGGDGVRKQFTGYERDTESGLDFAKARYDSSNLGRFTTPDPLMASAKRTSPQTFNRYSYVLNNPLNLTDSSGLLAQSAQQCPPICGTMVPLDAPITAATAMIVAEVEVIATKEAVDAVFAQVVSAYEGGVSSAITTRPLITLPTMIGAAGFIFATPLTVNPTNCPVNLCPGGAGPALETADDDADPVDILFRGVTVRHPGL